MRRLWILICLVMAACTSAVAQSQAEPLKTNGDVWWKHAVIYEVYPRSFQDTNGDGLGDIKGIEQRLSYLKGLGVDAIWITPMYPSPQVDFGYDIANYEAIDPQYGSMGDFDALLKAAKQQGLRVLMDMVMNHTSDQHPWFLESRSSRTNPKRDWYIWRDGKNGGPPNNWQSWFGHSAWTLDPKTGQYYYHYFYVQQPDLNWRNPEVRKAMYDAMRFWLDKGVAGFRIDAISRLFEDPNLHDDPILPGKNAFGDPNIVHKYTDNLPEVHDVLKELRTLVDSYPGDRVLLSEADEPNIVELSKMYGAHNDEVQLPMDFQIADANELSATKFRKLFDEVENNPAHGWPEYFFSNHDQPRQWDRYGDGKHNDEIAKMLAALEMMPRGTPQMYYGEELGMRTTTPTRVEDVKDPEGITGWPKNKGRDGERTPMQWTAARPNAGFTWPTAKPWLPIPPSSVTYNVDVESKDPDSILNFYKSLMTLRRTEPALVSGGYVTINPDDQNVFSFLRHYLGNGRSVLVALNMSDKPQLVTYDLSAQGVQGGIGLMLLNSYGYKDKTIRLYHMTIPPFGSAVIGVK
ncbi:MAG TPA: alpha-glucosidase [Acidobacteriaceae bacterium]|nr:alpha-glucosidase [Acidobacteriaceae bacterium]